MAKGVRQFASRRFSVIPRPLILTVPSGNLGAQTPFSHRDAFPTGMPLAWQGLGPAMA